MKAGYRPVVGSPQPPDRSRRSVKVKRIKARLERRARAKGEMALPRSRKRRAGGGFLAKLRTQFLNKMKRALKGHKPRKDFRNHGFRGTKSMSRTGWDGR